MKKLAVVLATGALLLTIGAAPASAVSCKAFNKGTYQAAHVATASGNGLYKLALACHFG